MDIDDEPGALSTLATWAKRFALLGAAFGVWLMFEKETLIAESGRKPDDVAWYSFWVPVMGIVGAIAGAAFGVIAVGWGKLREWAGMR